MALPAGWPGRPARGQEGATPPHWIWTATRRPLEQTPAGTVYFRKPFAVKEVSRLALDVTADNRYVLYLDGKEIARGDDWHTVRSVTERVETGPHVLAAEATNDRGPAGFLLGGGVLPLGQNVPIHTNGSWKVAESVPPGDGWTRIDFDDSGWRRAADLGSMGREPWTGLRFESGDASGRFKVPAGFAVRMAAAPEVTGSAISFTFDAEGRPCVGVEQGPIVQLVDADGDGRFEGRKMIAPGMRNCQGFSFIEGALYAVGDGPRRTGLYRLTDADRDGVFEQVELVRATQGGMGEHGPHSIQLGPDGRLYYNNGNHAHLKPPVEPRSPSNIAYEGELLPHYNDARGHAAGILAPGGEIYRSDDEGKTWDRVVAGFRNEYDFAFNRDGELFTFDSDMEWDIGLPWYRPVRVNHCIEGAEFGWRNGSGKWPPYYFDSLPSTLDVGRGSPTGVAFYQAGQFPGEYDDNFLICDWSQGRILAVALTRSGATYKAEARELVAGQPLNCTDIEVGPDGAVYFTTGGRGTQGGLFRVEWTGPKRERRRPRGPLSEALSIDSPLSSFAQARVAQIKEKLGEQAWETMLKALLVTFKDTKAPTKVRALDLLAQLGPEPDESLLTKLASDEDVRVRAKAVALLGLHDSAGAREALTKALGDPDPFVRRRACEALVRARGPIPVDPILPLLADSDRWVRYAARNALEHAGPAAHRGSILAARATRPLLEGMLALVRAGQLDVAGQGELLGRQVELLGGVLEPDDRLDLLRLIGLTYLLGPRKPAEDPHSAQLVQLLLNALPGREGPIRRETARLLAYLGGPLSPRIITEILDLQRDEPDHATQIHYAYCLRVLKHGWTTGEKRRLWAWYEAASRWDGGFSFLGYLDFMIQELVPLLTRDEQHAFLAEGETYPFPTRVLVRSIDLNAAPERIGELEALYTRLGRSRNAAAAGELRSMILAAVGRSRRPAAHRVLRGLFETDPPRRDQIARALAEHPTEDDLPTLAAALETRDPNTAATLVAALRKLRGSPEGPEGLRNLIRLARRTGPSMLDALNELAARWTRTDPPPGPFNTALAAWEQAYLKRYPRGPELAVGNDQTQNAYTLEQLRQLLGGGLRSPKQAGSPERGKAVIAKARCLDCHKLGDQGQGLGPDLTTVSSRFRPIEILESIVEPSKVISDQYKSLAVATTDGRILNGMPVASDADKLSLLLSDGTKVTLPKAEIEEQKPSTVSVMPEGLLNGLTVQEITDLLALFDSMPRVETPANANAGTGPAPK